MPSIVAPSSGRSRRTPGAGVPKYIIARPTGEEIPSGYGNLSGQIGDIDYITQVQLNARATVGSAIQHLNSISSSLDSQAVNNTKVQSSIEDADIAKVISQFSQTQTALQAAYGTTTRLESKSLFEYLQ